MKKILFTILVLMFIAVAYSADKNVIFSKYDSALNYVSVNKYGAYVFSGDIEVTGTLIFTFDMGSSSQAVDVLFARFVPDQESLKRLPVVIGGTNPGPIRYISLESAETALVYVFGKEKAGQLKHGNGAKVSVPVTVRLMKLLTGVESDSRTYWSTSFTARRIEVR